MNNKLKAAAIAGGVFGLLSAIPFINWVNFCCCLWAILGGMVASNLYVKSSPVPASAGDGAVLGAIAGVIGAGIFIILGIPLGILSQQVVQTVLISLMENADPSQADMVRRQMEASAGAYAGMIIQYMIGAVLLFVFFIIGGLIGIPIFEKRKGGPMPPPPPPAGGPYAAA